jgi:hypothetical protein
LLLSYQESIFLIGREDIMTIHPDEAARSLSEVRDRQRRAVAAGLVPNWFWWAIAALVTVFSAGIESKRPALIAIATTVFGIGIAASVVVVVTRGKAQVRNDLLGPAAGAAIAGFVIGVVAVTLGVAFSLRAAGVAYPATWASLVNAAGMIIGGPILMQRLHAMASRRAIGQS